MRVVHFANHCMRFSSIANIVNVESFSHADLVHVLFEFTACNNNIGLYQVGQI